MLSKTYRLRAVAAVALAAALLAAGCGSGSEPSADGTTTLQFLTFTSPNVDQAVWEEAAARVEAANPGLTIDLLYTPNLDRQAYASQLLATGQLPDILWDAPASSFVEAGALLPFTQEDLAGLNVPEGYGTVDGQTYNMWNGTFVHPGMFFNRQLFEEAGVAVPTTWAELVTAATALKATGTTPFLLQSGADLSVAGFLLQAIVNADLISATPDWSVQRKAGSVRFADPDFRAAVDKFVQLRDAGMFNPDAASLNYAQATARWQAGEAAIWPMGSWASATAVNGFDVGVFTMPTDDGTTVVPIQIGGAGYVSAATGNPELARKATVELVTDPAWQALDMQTDAVLPVVDGIEPLPGTTQATLDTLAMVEDTSATQVTGFLAEAGDASAPDGFADAFGSAMQALIGGASTEEFVTTLDTEYDALNR